MDTMASKNSSANGSDRASAWIGNTPSSTPASRIRWMFSETLNHRSVAQTCTPNSRRRKIDDDARPQPRSSNRMPGRKSSAAASHSVIHSALAPPLALAMTHSGWYFEERGNRSETNRWSDVMWTSACRPPQHPVRRGLGGDDKAFEIQINPARDVPQPVRRHPSAITETTVHVGGSPRMEVFDHHEQHRSRTSSNHRL